MIIISAFTIINVIDNILILQSLRKRVVSSADFILIVDPSRVDEYHIADEKDVKPVFSTVYTSVIPSVDDLAVFDVESL